MSTIDKSQIANAVVKELNNRYKHLPQPRFILRQKDSVFIKIYVVNDWHSCCYFNDKDISLFRHKSTYPGRIEYSNPNLFELLIEHIDEFIVEVREDNQKTRCCKR